MLNDRDPRYTPPFEGVAGNGDIRTDAVWRRDRYAQMAVAHLCNANEARRDADTLMSGRAWDLRRYADDQMRRHEECRARAAEWGKRC